MARDDQVRIGYSWTASRAGIMPRIVSAYYWDIASHDVMGRSLHDLWVLDYSRADCGRVRVGSQRSRWWTRPSHVAHLYPPRTPYWEDTSGVGGPVREAFIIFAGGDEAGLGRLIGSGQCFARIDDCAGRLDALLREMATIGHTLGESGFWQAQATMAILFDALAGAVGQADGTVALRSVPSPQDGRGSVAEAADDYFRTHLAEKVKLATVARHLAMSPSALSHRYREETGRSPMASLAAMRIDLAKSFLLRGLKLDAVARQTGFFDAFHFSKAFKKRCGISPSQFRQGLWRTAGERR
jgi:AraC-like DNA-binding protein